MDSLQRFSLSILLTLAAVGANLPPAMAQDCSAESISLRSQTEIDNFQNTYGNGVVCTVVRGLLRIDGDDITNLAGLTALTSVGALFITNNSALTSLDGLGALTSVEDTLDIDGNSALTNLDGLGALTSVGNNLAIWDNLTLTNLEGLGSLMSVGYALDISLNSALTNLDGLGALTSVGQLSVGFNSSLTNLDGLSALTSAGGLNIFDNPSLTNLDSLSALTSVGFVTIGNHNALTNLDGLSGLTSISGSLLISRNLALTNLDGLSALTSVGNTARILANSALINLDGLEALTTVGGDLNVSSNDSLTSCAGIAPVLGWPTAPYDADSDLVGGSVTIESNATGAQNTNDCLDAFMPNTTVMLFDQRQPFLEATDAQLASAMNYELLLDPPEPYVSGDIAFSTGPDSFLDFRSWGANLDDPTGVQLAIFSVEDLDIENIPGGVFAMGVSFDDASGGSAASTFRVGGFLNGEGVFLFNFTTPPVNGRNFIGVWSSEPFDTLRIRETQTANENEFFGRVFTSTLALRDSDGDGVVDGRDSCDNTAAIEVNLINAQGCGPSERDTDGDGVNDGLDAFPLDPNEQRDSDGDGFGDNQETDAGSDPNDADDVPSASGLPAWLLFEASQ